MKGFVDRMQQSQRGMDGLKGRCIKDNIYSSVSSGNVNNYERRLKGTLTQLKKQSDSFVFHDVSQYFYDAVLENTSARNRSSLQQKFLERQELSLSPLLPPLQPLHNKHHKNHKPPKKRLVGNKKEKGDNFRLNLIKNQSIFKRNNWTFQKIFRKMKEFDVTKKIILKEISTNTSKQNETPILYTSKISKNISTPVKMSPGKITTRSKTKNINKYLYKFKYNLIHTATTISHKSIKTTFSGSLYSTETYTNSSFIYNLRYNSLSAPQKENFIEEKKKHKIKQTYLPGDAVNSRFKRNKDHKNSANSFANIVEDTNLIKQSIAEDNKNLNTEHINYKNDKVDKSPDKNSNIEEKRSHNLSVDLYLIHHFRVFTLILFFFFIIISIFNIFQIILLRKELIESSSYSQLLSHLSMIHKSRRIDRVASNEVDNDIIGNNSLLLESRNTILPKRNQHHPINELYYKTLYLSDPNQSRSVTFHPNNKCKPYSNCLNINYNSINSINDSFNRTNLNINNGDDTDACMKNESIVIQNKNNDIINITNDNLDSNLLRKKQLKQQKQYTMNPTYTQQQHYIQQNPQQLNRTFATSHQQHTQQQKQNQIRKIPKRVIFLNTFPDNDDLLNNDKEHQQLNNKQHLNDFLKGNYFHNNNIKNVVNNSNSNITNNNPRIFEEKIFNKTINKNDCNIELKNTGWELKLERGDKNTKRKIKKRKQKYLLMILIVDALMISYRFRNIVFFIVLSIILVAFLHLRIFLYTDSTLHYVFSHVSSRSCGVEGMAEGVDIKILNNNFLIGSYGNDFNEFDGGVVIKDGDGWVEDLVKDLRTLENLLEHGNDINLILFYLCNYLFLNKFTNKGKTGSQSPTI